MIKVKTGVVGSGAMGSGIAQVAATAGYDVVLFDADQQALQRAQKSIASTLTKLAAKGKITEEESKNIGGRITYAASLTDFKDCKLIIEAIIENLEIKQKVFQQLEDVVGDDCILATNTSSLSVTSIAGACRIPARFCGIHFFNPAPLMPLVEIIPAVQTTDAVFDKAKSIIDAWNKVTVKAKDTPGFIVNRVARSFYGEALRMYEEQIASIPFIDHAMKVYGGFKMGPFELMDLIGNDINYTVTETVWKQMYFDARYKPSLTQKRMTEAGRLGRKSGRGYYDYSEDAITPEVVNDEAKALYIVNRIVCMLINEAADAVYYGIATVDDVDLAMTKGVNYPKGLLKWCDDLGIKNVCAMLDAMHGIYNEERYRTSVLLKKMLKEDKKFYHE